MGNGYNHHLHHHHQRRSFLPMLCSRTSIKDVHLPKWQDRSASSSSSSSYSGDPSSPRVSCMGQVKRNNRVIGFPTPNKFATDNIKYHKLRRLFSGKSLTTATRPSTAITSRREMVVDSARGPKLSDDNDNYALVNVAELDPPLPVIKKGQQPADGRDEVNLWKRRSGGLALKTLQLQQIPTT